MTFAEVVRNARQKAGMTQEELAERIGVSRRTVNSYENGRSWPKNNARYRLLAKTLDLPVSALTMVEERYEGINAEGDRSDFEKKFAEGLAGFHSLFAGGVATSDDLDNYMQELQKIYWDLKKRIGDEKRGSGAGGEAGAGDPGKDGSKPGGAGGGV